MSIPVDVTDLPRALADFDRGYLLTCAEGRIKVVSVRAEPIEDALVVRAPGRGSIANAAANPAVTLLFPPLVAGGFTLLVDGAAAVKGDDARITPASAVLHKSVP